MTGYQIDQSRNPNYTKIVNAARAGLLDGIIGLENFAKEPREDYDNIQPRLGAAYDLRGDGKDVIRGGWGVYYDVSYTNSSVLFPALDATGIGFGQIFNVTDQAGIRNPDGSFYRIDQPISNIASQNLADPNVLPLIGQFLDPRVEQPFTKQASIGWSHELMASTVLTVDYVRIDGRDLNIRPRLNTVMQPSGMRRLAFVGLLPNAATTRPAVSRGESTYQRVDHRREAALLERLRLHRDLHAGEREEHDRHGGRRAVDRQHPGLDQSVRRAGAERTEPADGRASQGGDQRGGAVAAGHHGVAVVHLPVGASGLHHGRRRHQSRRPVERHPRARAYAFDGVGNAPKELGACETVNCGRGAKNTQFNLKRDEVVRPRPRDAPRSDRRGLQPVQREEPRRLPSDQRPEPPPRRRPAQRAFLQPTAYAGDFQQGEQLVGQIGFRFTF